MPYTTDIQSIEDEINKLGESLCKLLKPALDTDRLRSLESSFLFKHYWSAIESIEWYIDEKILTLPETALDNWTQLKTHADKAKKLYALQRESDGGFTNPITHMNALMKADDKIPDGFNKRYGLKRGGAKYNRNVWSMTCGKTRVLFRRFFTSSLTPNGLSTAV